MWGQPGFQTAAGFVGDIRAVVKAGKKAIACSKITFTTPPPMKCSLAVSIGDLTKETYEKLDEEMQIMFAGAIQEFGDVRTLSYNTVLALLMNNSLLEPMEGATITRADKLIKSDTDWFKWNGKSLNNNQVKDVKSWFARLIQDKEIIDDIQLDLAFFGKVLDYAKQTVNLFEASVTSKNYHENKIIDVVVLRYPDQEHPFLMLYQILLKAFRDGSRDEMTQEDTNGLTGEFHSVKFKPRTSLINSLSGDIMKNFVGQGRACVRRNGPRSSRYCVVL